MLSFTRRYFFLFVAVCFVALVGLSLRLHLLESVSSHLVTPPPPPPPPPPSPAPKPPPVTENFPSAANGHLPPILTLNRPPENHTHHPTPLFIGFTRNWPILQQSVVSYITAGWPPTDIYIIDNTGTMDSNALNLLTLQNPFYLSHRRLQQLGVNVLTAPTLLTFAQLQNYFITTAAEHRWPHFYWSHMDSVALSDEDTAPYRSLYRRVLDAWAEMDHAEKWGIKFFAYDHLALVNVAAMKDVGAWDTQIPFYATDCDMHSRLEWGGYSTSPQRAGRVFDVAATVPDLRVFYPEGPEEGLNGTRFRRLVDTLEGLQREKNEAVGGRNNWQSRQTGGQGEPFYRDPEVGIRTVAVVHGADFDDVQGFEKAINMWIDQGRKVFAEKWGHKGCNINKLRKTGDAWRVPHDWEEEPAR